MSVAGAGGFAAELARHVEQIDASDSSTGSTPRSLEWLLDELGGAPEDRHLGPASAAT